MGPIRPRSRRRRRMGEVVGMSLDCCASRRQRRRQADEPATDRYAGDAYRGHKALGVPVLVYGAGLLEIPPMQRNLRPAHQAGTAFAAGGRAGLIGAARAGLAGLACLAATLLPEAALDPIGVALS